MTAETEFYAAGPARSLALKTFAGLCAVFAICALLLSPACPVAEAAARQGAQAPAKAAPKRASGPVMIMPFQINGGPEVENLQQDLPAMLGQRLASRGIPVIPAEQVINFLRANKITGLDLATVRKLVRSANAAGAIYGSFSKVGDAYSLDARVVTSDGSKPVKPVFIEQTGKLNLVSIVDELSSRAVSEFMNAETINSVEVRGTRVLDPEVVLMRINAKKGDPIDPAMIDREVKRIWDLGYFSDVSASIEQRPDGPCLVYSVTEKPRIEAITVEGAKEIDEDDIRAAMSTKPGSILNEKLLAQDLQKIEELYRKDGYYLAKVEYRIDQRKDGEAAALVLNISEGNKLYVKEVRLEGVQQLDVDDVEDEMAIKTRGILSWFTGTGILKEDLLERDAAAITAYYMNHGFMDVHVSEAKVTYEEDGIIVGYTITEGQRYRLGGVKFVGDLIDTDEKLASVTKLDDMAQKKEFFSLKVMQDDTASLTDYYADYGYAFANVMPKPEKNPEDEGSVNITYSIDKRQKVYIHRVVLEGNNRTRDNVVLREMRLVDGDLFSGSKLRRSMERLNKLGYFEVAEAELVPTSNEEEVDLKVTLKEKPTGALIGGIGYSTYSNFGVSGTIMEQNLWGKGYSLALQAQLSGRRNAYTLSFTNPRVYDTDLAAGFDIYNWRDDFYDYDKKTTGGTVRMGYPIGEYTSVGLGYKLEFYELYDFDDNASHYIRDYAGNRVTSSVLGRIGRDTTDRQRPTTGNIDRIDVEYAGGLLGGDDKFIIVNLEHQTYYQLEENHILHLRAKASGLFKNGDDEVPVFERFWMGGMGSVRGYKSKDIVPQDPLTGDHLGGDRMAFANFEYIWTAFPELGINLVPFFDIGALIDTNQDEGWNDAVKKSVGLELRWRSPMGDLRFSYGYPLDKSWDGDKLGGRFEFSMGQFF